MQLQEEHPKKRSHKVVVKDNPVDPEKILNELSDRLTDPEIMEEITNYYDFSNDQKLVESFKANLSNDHHLSSTIKQLDNLDDDIMRTIVTETIVLEFGRPSLVIHKDQVKLPASAVWRDRIDQNLGSIATNIPSVGRIELMNHPSYAWCGTGWLLKNSNYVITNRHVARVFADYKTDHTFGFRQNFSGRIIDSFVDFKEEHNQPEAATFKVKDIVFMSNTNEPDVAILELHPSNYNNDQLAKGLEIDITNDIHNEFVYTIGYPARDTRIKDASLMEKIFHGVYNVKRLALGKGYTIANDYLFHHDCSTLGGNSGSPVIHLKTGKVIGLHFAGTYRKHNWAVKADYMNDLFYNTLNI